MITSLDELLSRYAYLRVALESDNSHILEFLRTVPMETDSMILRYDRSPDYFSYLKQQGDKEFSFIFENKDRSIGGIASLSFRDHYVNGRKTRVAYLCDLRIHPRLYRRTRVEWRRCYVDLVANYRHIQEFDNCEYFYTAIIEQNLSAMNALTKGKSDFIYRELGKYKGLHILGQLPGYRIVHKTRKIFSRVGVARHADAGDLGALRAFLYRENMNMPFTDYITMEGKDELERRFCEWNDFSISSFVIVENAKHDIIGCASPWSNQSARRFVVEDLSFRDRAVGALLPLLGGERLIIRQPLKTLNLSHMEIDSGLNARTRKKVLIILLDFIFSARMHKGYHIVSLLDYADLAFGSALHSAGFVTRTTRGVLYQVMSSQDMAECHLIPTEEGVCPKFELGIA